MAVFVILSVARNHILKIEITAAKAAVILF